MDFILFYLKKNGLEMMTKLDNIKIILTEGDSWTAGDILDPKLEKSEYPGFLF